MAFNEFKFEPEEGFLDSSFYENSPSDSRAILQRQHNQTRDYINDVVDKIKSTREGESGSEHIGSPKIDGLDGENVFSQIKDMKRQLEYASAGNLSDSSIKEAMLSKACVTGEKIASEAIDTSHFKKDAVCPVSNDTKNINGMPSDLYQPIVKAGSWGNFKERVSDNKIASIHGKNRNGIRYFYGDNGKILKLDISNGEITEYLDFSSYSTDFKFTFDNNGIPYLGYLSKADSILYINLYKYEEEFVFLNKIQLGHYSNWATYFNDIEIYNDLLYIAYSESGNYSSVYLYRVALEQITELSSLTPFISKRTDTAESRKRIIFVNGDLCFSYFRLKNCSEKDVIEYPWTIIEYEDGKMLVKHDYYILIDENFLPCQTANYVMVNNDFIAKAFIYDRHFYMITGEYLFRSRIY